MFLFLGKVISFLPLYVFFFNDTATTEIYTLSLHDALPISAGSGPSRSTERPAAHARGGPRRSEEHTSELQSQFHLVCRLLLAKKNKYITFPTRSRYNSCTRPFLTHETIK